MPYNRKQKLSPVERFGIKFQQVRQIKIETEDEKENERRKEKAKQADILKEKNDLLAKKKEQMEKILLKFVH